MYYTANNIKNYSCKQKSDLLKMITTIIIISKFLREQLVTHSQIDPVM